MSAVSSDRVDDVITESAVFDFVEYVTKRYDYTMCCMLQGLNKNVLGQRQATDAMRSIDHEGMPRIIVTGRQ